MPLRRNGLKIGDIEDRPDGGMGSTMVRGSGEAPHTIDWRRSLAARNARTRGRRHHPVFRIRDELSPRWRMSLTLVGLVVPLLIWLFMATSGSAWPSA